MDLQDVRGVVGTAGFEEPDEGLDHARRAPDARARARGRRHVTAHQLRYLPRRAHLPRPATAQKLHRQVSGRRTPGTLRPAPRSAPARAGRGARGAGRRVHLVQERVRQRRGGSAAGARGCCPLLLWRERRRHLRGARTERCARALAGLSRGMSTARRWLGRPQFHT
jgi:hypothetical protein